MAEPNFIARLYPLRGVDGMRKLVKFNEALLRLNPKLLRREAAPYSPEEPQKPRYNGRDRQGTEPPESPNTLDDGDYLELTFDDEPKTRLGFIFGLDEKNCDILLPPLKGISFHHCALTFEKDFADTINYRLVLKDLGSLVGTTVTYDGRGNERRSGFRWIVSGHDAAYQRTGVIIKIHEEICFKLVVGLPRILLPPHVARIAQLLRPRAPETLFAELDLGIGVSTARATGAHTPKSGPITIKLASLGQGAFGNVTLCWDVSTGQRFAKKTPSRTALRDGEVDVAAWAKEAQILEKVSHSQIVRLFSWQIHPFPQLYLEYVPGGSLDRHLRAGLLPYDRCLEITRQGLSALAYLHGLTPPIVHRDIKPANILVDESAGFQIKLADFGLSREDRELTTICGTPKYFAPEIFQEQSRRQWERGRKSYSSAVDIWSFGVVAHQCLSGLPAATNGEQGFNWCELVNADVLIEAQSGQLSDILASHMVVLEPHLRASAQACLEQVQVLCRTSLTSAYDALTAYNNTTAPSPQPSGRSPAREITSFPALRASPAPLTILDDFASTPSYIAGYQDTPTSCEGTPRQSEAMLRPALGAERCTQLVIPTIEVDPSETTTVVLGTVLSSSNRLPAGESRTVAGAGRPSSPRGRSASSPGQSFASWRNSWSGVAHHRVTKSSQVTACSRASHGTILGGSTRRTRSATRPAQSRSHQDALEETKPQYLDESMDSDEDDDEKEGLSSGYMGGNPLLDPLWVGSEVAAMGRELVGNARAVPRSVAPRGGIMVRGDEDKSSEVVLTDSWLRQPAYGTLPSPKA